MRVLPLRAVIIGAGNRSIEYASYAGEHPDELKIVGIAEPDDIRRRKASEMFEIPRERCFQSAEKLAQFPVFADAAINGTMDPYHVPTTLPLLEAGYDVLLEKPMAPNEKEMSKLLETVNKTGRKVVICHVLRYAPFYAEIYKNVVRGEIGEIIAIHTSENVSYHHMAAGFIRGKWNKREVNPMLLAKCCHDMDLFAWFKSSIAPIRVSSFGSLMYFRPEKAPSGSGTRCLVDCRIEESCPYSAKKNYIEQDLWRSYAWECLEHILNPTIEQKLESLRKDNPFGRCVWRCDNDVVDHQSVIVEFEDGAVATHDMIGGVARPCRKIHICGTKGEIQGTMEDGWFVIHKPDARAGHEYSETKSEINISEDMHGGGDMRLVQDFIRVVRDQRPSVSTTDIMDSVRGHQIAYAADYAMNEKRVIDIACDY